MRVKYFKHLHLLLANVIFCGYYLNYMNITISAIIVLRYAGHKTKILFHSTDSLYINQPVLINNKMCIRDSHCTYDNRLDRRNNKISSDDEIPLYSDRYKLRLVNKVSTSTMFRINSNVEGYKRNFVNYFAWLPSH